MVQNFSHLFKSDLDMQDFKSQWKGADFVLPHQFVPDPQIYLSALLLLTVRQDFDF